MISTLFPFSEGQTRKLNVFQMGHEDSLLVFGGALPSILINSNSLLKPYNSLFSSIVVPCSEKFYAATKDKMIGIYVSKTSRSQEGGSATPEEKLLQLIDSTASEVLIGPFTFRRLNHLLFNQYHGFLALLNTQSLGDYDYDFWLNNDNTFLTARVCTPPFSGEEVQELKWRLWVYLSSEAFKTFENIPSNHPRQEKRAIGKAYESLLQQKCTHTPITYDRKEPGLLLTHHYQIHQLILTLPPFAVSKEDCTTLEAVVHLVQPFTTKDLTGRMKALQQLDKKSPHLMIQLDPWGEIHVNVVDSSYKRSLNT